MSTARAATSLLILSMACGGASSPPVKEAAPPAAEAKYEATIRWTSYGIPHIVARDLGSLTFGQGYAFAKNHICILADQAVKVRGERARFFGPGQDDVNIDSDFGYLALGFRASASEALRRLSPESLEVLRGFVAGYNHYLDEVGPAGLPAACRNAEWVRRLDDEDLVAYSMEVARIASGAAFARLIGNAQPGVKSDEKSARLELPSIRAALASNAWVIGADRTETGRGMLVANPHFPWEGAHKFYEAHLTIPGELDAYGAQLMGVPLLSFAFNQHLAWTHTFSASTQFTLYRLRLDPDNPTRYRYGQDIREMSSRKHAISVRQPDGSLKQVERTLYRSHYGPMLRADSLPWDPAGGYAFTMRDAARDTLQMADQYLAMLRATDLASFRAAMERYQSTPYVNTLYADRDGNIFYADGSRVPNLSDAALIAWEVALKAMPAARAAWKRGIVVLDGSLPLFEWMEDGAGPQGSVPFARAPQLTRRDFLFNANDSYWIANPAQPLVGHSRLYGEAEEPLSARSRMNLAILSDTRPNGHAGDDGKFSAAELERAALGNQSFTADLLRDEVVQRCVAAQKRAAAATRKKSEEVEANADLATACTTLSEWDGRFDLGSRGAVLWREFVGSYTRDEYRDGTLFAEAFDPSRPLATPRGLPPVPKKGPDPVLRRLELAIERLREAGIDPFLATLADVQFTDKGEVRIPIHGGASAEGVTNYAGFDIDRTTLLPHMDRGDALNTRTGLSKRGYPVNYGTSFFLVLAFTDDGPSARAIMTYSASSDPSSPHFRDQTEMWSRKELRPVLFTSQQIEADVQLKIQQIAAPKPARP